MKRWLKFYDEGVNPSLNYPGIAVHEILKNASISHPESTATVFYSKKTTYSQIDSQSDAVAFYLERILSESSRVALLMPNFPGFISSYYGVLKSSNTAVLLNPLYTENELSYQLSDSSSSVIITIPMFVKKAVALKRQLNLKEIIVINVSDYLPFPKNLLLSIKEKSILYGIKDRVINFKDILKQYRAKYTPKPINTSNEAVIIYSGGTTGVAKGIVLSHKAIVKNAFQISAWGHLNENESILAVLPLFHGFGMNVCMNASILNGMKLILLPRFKAEEMARTISKEKPTLTAAVPTMLVALSNLKNINKYDFTSLKAVWVGAAPLTKAIKENFEQKARCRVIEGYGLTECVTAIMANPFKGKHKIGSIGIPFPDVDAKIVDLEDGKTQKKPNEIGEIILHTPTVMNGYLNREEETKKTIKDGWLYTGDVGYMDEDGYFYITDRKKELIIVGGFNVFPREIEEVLYRFKATKEAAVIGVPHKYKGEMVKAFVVLKEGYSASEEEIKNFLRKHLAPYKIPSEIAFVNELPKNAIGKILKRKLKEEEVEKR